MSTKSKSPRQIARDLYDEQQRRLEAAEAENANLKARVTALEDEIHVLLERISALTLQIAQAEGRPEQMALKLELKVLQERLAKHASDTFGTSRSERRRKEERKQKRRRKSKRPKEPPATQLPIEELIHKRSEEEGDCPRCGDPMQEADGKSRVGGTVTRPTSRRTVRTLFVYGSSERRVFNPRDGRFSTSTHPHGRLI